MGEWMASFASCGYTIRFGRDQLVVEFAASVKGINKSTGASFTLTAGKWGVMVGAVG
jgi:hypothetical protein